MKNIIKKSIRAASLSTGFALGMAGFACASFQGETGGWSGAGAMRAYLFDNSPASDYNSPLSDSAWPLGGSGMGGYGSDGYGTGGSGMGLDTASLPGSPDILPGDTSMAIPLGYPEIDNTFHGGSGQGGSGSDTLGNPDYPGWDSIPDPRRYPGTGGYGDTGMGGSGTDPGTDGSEPPEDSSRSSDSLGVPDWEEQG